MLCHSDWSTTTASSPSHDFWVSTTTSPLATTTATPARLTRASRVAPNSCRLRVLPISSHTPMGTSATTPPRSADSTAIETNASVTILRSEEHTSELQSLMRISYAVFCLKKKNKQTTLRNIMSQPLKHNNEM